MTPASSPSSHSPTPVDNVLQRPRDLATSPTGQHRHPQDVSRQTAEVRTLRNRLPDPPQLQVIRSNIVEGYGRRRYKADYIKFLTYAFASCLETQDHVETLTETGSLTDESTISHLTELTDKLGRKLNNFIQSVERQHRTK